MPCPCIMLLFGWVLRTYQSIPASFAVFVKSRQKVACGYLCLICSLQSEYYGIGVNLHNFSVWACNQRETFLLGSVDKTLLGQDYSAFYCHAQASDFFLVGISFKCHACLFAFRGGHEFANFLYNILIHLSSPFCPLRLRAHHTFSSFPQIVGLR